MKNRSIWHPQGVSFHKNAQIPGSLPRLWISNFVFLILKFAGATGVTHNRNQEVPKW